MLFADCFSAYIDRCIISSFHLEKCTAFNLLSLGQTPSVILARKHGGGEYSFRERTDQDSGFPPQHCCPQNWNLSRVLMIISSELQSPCLTVSGRWMGSGLWDMLSQVPSCYSSCSQGLGG